LTTDFFKRHWITNVLIWHFIIRIKMIGRLSTSFFYLIWMSIAREELIAIVFSVLYVILHNTIHVQNNRIMMNVIDNISFEISAMFSSSSKRTKSTVMLSAYQENRFLQDWYVFPRAFDLMNNPVLSKWYIIVFSINRFWRKFRNIYFLIS
jgi:hypothetical protein